ncbi:MAG: threonylcarbamoyl-AMP synthase, partial [Muribaculaceae bacterium]|nr:threonylcarbamoyl-AMP synthase [Muribaculaceae bacterium]
MNEAVNQDLNNCLDVLKRGGVIIYPTDTVWGIGCDATNSEAVKRVFAIKRRADSKALITLVDSVAALERVVAEVPEVAYQLIDVAVEPMTIVYDRGVGVAPELLADDGSIGVRITAEEFSRELCRRFRRPIVSTSINISGEDAPHSFGEINPELLDVVDYVCESKRDEPWSSKPSTVIKLSSGGLIK